MFGSQRKLNGQLQAPHFGVDIAAPANTPIHAPVDGTIVLAEPDFFLTGGTTVLDHGHGVFTSYVHQNTLKAMVGQVVKRGEVIGFVGMKGRATGPHLHWGVKLNGARVNPYSLLDLPFKNGVMRPPPAMVPTPETTPTPQTVPVKE